MLTACPIYVRINYRLNLGGRMMEKGKFEQYLEIGTPVLEELIVAIDKVVTLSEDFEKAVTPLVDSCTEKESREICKEFEKTDLYKRMETSMKKLADAMGV